MRQQQTLFVNSRLTLAEAAEEIHARTGCIGCPLASKDLALDHVLSIPEWSYLQPLKRMRPLYIELRSFRHRKQKDGERNKNGNYSSHPSRKGPLILEAREWALGEVLGVQNEINARADKHGKPMIDLINAEEERRIRELLTLRTYPQRWSDADPNADILIPQTYRNGDIQAILPLEFAR
jgi:DNA sulfur modification protein DndC